MNSILLIFLIFIVAALIIYMWINKTRSGSINESSSNLNKTINSESQDSLEERLKKLILQGQMIKAIKEYRISTGASLVDAKNYVDALAAAIKEGKSMEAFKKPEADSAEIEAKVKELLLQGQKIKAVKAYREATGCDLLTAKKYVDSIQG
ncbi:hypothetical protein ACJDT4_11270 [Clostridium neuense]|uniref:50S ribosomal protein L7/L12 n=1 Tax=Clostridium neuense TaxID=1728934 RepID=A0ABW8TH29_9CLOT